MYTVNGYGYNWSSFVKHTIPTISNQFKTHAPRTWYVQVKGYILHGQALNIIHIQEDLSKSSTYCVFNPTQPCSTCRTLLASCLCWTMCAPPCTPKERAQTALCCRSCRRPWELMSTLTAGTRALSSTITPERLGVNNTAQAHDAASMEKVYETVLVVLSQVSYDVIGFCERNRDVLFPDLIELMQSSE